MGTGTLRKFTFRSVLIVFFASFASTLCAQTPSYFFPGSNVNYTGGSNSFPLNAASTGSNKCQWLYRPTDFNTTLPGTLLISKIYFKPSATRSNQSIANLQFKMANTALTTLTSGTWHTGFTTVYNGGSSVTISTTANSWYAITLSTPFVYTGGGILFEITHTNSSAPGITINQFSVSGRSGRMYGNASNASSTGADAATALFGFDAAAPCSGSPLAPSITTSTMSTATPICSGSTMALTATNPNLTTGITFQWQSGATSTGPFSNVTTGTGATTLNYTTGPVTADTWYRIGAICSNSNITTYSSAFRVRVGASQPGTISGPATFCPGDVAIYSVPAVAGHTYSWTLPAGWSGSSTTNSISLTAGANSGTISVIANGCGAPSIARTRTTVKGSAPAVPGAITGLTHPCANSNQTYSVAAVTGATFYTWSLPNGWSGTSTTNSIVVSVDTNVGNIRVKAGNTCGISNDAIKAVTPIRSLSNLGAITTSATNNVYCAGGLYTFSINPIPGATSYQWTLPSGWTGTNAGTTIQAFAGASGNLSVTAYVACATSPTSIINTSVSTTLAPSVSIASSTSTICSGLPVTFTATPTNGGTTPFYQWKKNGLNVTGTGANYTTASLVTGDVISVAMASNATCRALDTARSNAITSSVITTVSPGIGINSTPVITTCAGTTLNFSTTTTGGGTTPTYQWFLNGSAIGGAITNSYSGSAFSNGDTLTVRMTTSAVCATASTALSNKVGLVVNPVVVPSITISASSTNPRELITFTAVQNGGGATPGYQWQLNGVDIGGEIASTYTTSSLVAGDHVSARLQSYDACAQPSSVTSNDIVIGNTTSIATASGWDGSVSLYPNPSGGRFTIAADWTAANIGKRVAIDVYNMLGQAIYHSEVAPDRTKWSYDIQLGDATPAGHYTIRLTTQNGMKANLPIVISK